MSDAGQSPIAAPTNRTELMAAMDRIDSAEAREQLIAAIDARPIANVPFYWQWMLVHDAFPYYCWTDDGYDPSLSRFSPDIQVLAAIDYGIADIWTNGFHGFFWNGPGVMAPEMAQWLERAELNAAAEVVRRALSVFGSEFPRAQSRRQAAMSKLTDPECSTDASRPCENRELFDSFMMQLEDALLDQAFEEAKEKWIREVCGVKKLSDVSWR